MSTPVSTAMLLRRVVARAGIGVWQNRVRVLLALIVAVGLGTYMGTNGGLQGPLALSDRLSGLTASGSSTVATDCADTAMAAIANKGPSAVQGAYRCMDSSFQQRVPEQVFAQQMQTQALPNVSSIARVGDYRPPHGGTMVYYAVDSNGTSVGFIVYLGQDGKVQKIE